MEMLEGRPYNWSDWLIIDQCSYIKAFGVFVCGNNIQTFSKLIILVQQHLLNEANTELHNKLSFLLKLQSANFRKERI